MHFPGLMFVNYLKTVKSRYISLDSILANEIEPFITFLPS